MQRFQQVFGSKSFSVIGMIHVKALPGTSIVDIICTVHLVFNQTNIATGTPKYDGNFNAIIEQARHEANIYRKHKIVSQFLL